MLQLATMDRHRILLGIAVGTLIALAALVSRLSGPNIATSVEEIRDRGELVVLTLKGPTIYRAGANGPDGYEVDIARAFARSLGATPRFVVKPDIDSLLSALNRGQGHVATGNLTITEAREAQIRFGPPYKNVKEQLVCRRGGVVPDDLSELAGVTIGVVDGSSYIETLSALRVEAPDLTWRTRAAGSAMPLLAAVDAGDIDCTVADSHLVDHAQRRLPELLVAFDLTEDRPLAWAVSSRTAGLGASLDAWFAEAHERGFLHELDERWFGHLADFDYVDTARFRRRIETRLPAYREMFETAAADTPFDWRLIAAQAYQESHWDPDARSVTGVRGLMMVTQSTARRVGIDNRLDPAQSIRGGVAYLADLYRRVPDGVTGEDRLWFALAAYNVGMGHMYDARRLAERQGLDKNSWLDLRETLPLLTQARHYRTLRYGYARGYEPVRYVQKIREYYTILKAEFPDTAVPPTLRTAASNQSDEPSGSAASLVPTDGAAETSAGRN